MSDIADKLRRLRGALATAVDDSDLGGIWSPVYETRHNVMEGLESALAEFPDPDAVGYFVERGLSFVHDLDCLRGKATGESPDCTCGGDAALDKLEKKT